MPSNPSKPPVVLTPEARDDLAQIRLYTLKMWGESQADRYQGKLYDGFDLIQANPSIGRVDENLRSQYRMLRVESHFVIYWPTEEEITIIRILHGSRDLGRHLE